MSAAAGAAAKAPSAPVADLPRHDIEVAAKFGSTDAAGDSLLRRLPLLGIAGVREVRASVVYSLYGKYSSTQLHEIARELFCDPITQEYRLEKSTPSPAFLSGPHWRLEVRLKPSVSDPIADSAAEAVSALGFSRPVSVRTGKVFRIIGRLSKAQADTILSRLLANPVIHSAEAVQN